MAILGCRCSDKLEFFVGHFPQHLVYWNGELTKCGGKGGEMG